MISMLSTVQSAGDSHSDKENYDSAGKKKLTSRQLLSLSPLVIRRLTKDVRQLLQREENRSQPRHKVERP